MDAERSRRVCNAPASASRSFGRVSSRSHHPGASPGRPLPGAVHSSKDGAEAPRAAKTLPWGLPGDAVALAITQGRLRVGTRNAR
jgi:hypothetical protein